MNEIDDAVKYLEAILTKNDIDPRQGLPKSVFLMTSGLVPIVNVDLFITDYKRRVLFSWRDDLYHTKGWHIPGGCVRIQETLDTRVQKTALNEIGTQVEYKKQPITVRESIVSMKRSWLKNELERSHTISFLYQVKLPDGFEINNGALSEHERGYLKWFSDMPTDLIVEHKNLYGDILSEWFNEILEER